MGMSLALLKAIMLRIKITILKNSQENCCQMFLCYRHPIF